MLGGLISPRDDTPSGADGGDGLQMWGVIANMLNEQWLTTDKGGPPVYGLDDALTTSRRKKKEELLMKCSTDPGLGRIL